MTWYSWLNKADSLALDSSKPHPVNAGYAVQVLPTVTPSQLMYRRKTPDPDSTQSQKAMTRSPSPSRTKSSHSSSLLTSPSGQRALLILAGLLSLFIVTKIFFPSDPSSHLLPIVPTNLHPKNYLNASSSEPAPFEFCPLYGPGDPIATKYGAVNLARSKVHMGSGARVQRVVHKALSGLPVTISVLGGSSTYPARA